MVNDPRHFTEFAWTVDGHEDRPMHLSKNVHSSLTAEPKFKSVEIDEFLKVLSPEYALWSFSPHTHKSTRGFWYAVLTAPDPNCTCGSAFSFLN